ncbi:hypothetical protein [Streptomyces sp. NPDC059757]|uniref:hypothetical protein n=1 Tax=Streptomyces sp. NPDC059757 TaxID=3346935 RepID=UPI003669D6FA
MPAREVARHHHRIRLRDHARGRWPQLGESRAFAWIDDEVTEADRTWVKEHHDGPALLHRLYPRCGRAIDDFAELTAMTAVSDGNVGRPKRT